MPTKLKLLEKQTVYFQLLLLEGYERPVLSMVFSGVLNGKYICCMTKSPNKEYFEGHSVWTVCHSHTLVTSSPAYGLAKLTSLAWVLREDHPP